MNRPEQSEDESSICIGCGFCCNGTLHGHAEVSSNDETAVLAAGLAVINVGGKMIFRQPCPKFACGECMIYDRRPGVCRAYRCKVRRDLDEGRVSIVEAREKIRIAKSLLAAVLRIAPGASTADKRAELTRHLKDGLGQLEGEQHERAASTLLDVGKLEYFFDQWFYVANRKPSDIPSFSGDEH